MIIFDASALVSAALQVDSVPECALLRAEGVDVFGLSARGGCRDRGGSGAPEVRGRDSARGVSQVAKLSNEPVSLKIAYPEFGPNGLRCRLVKLEHPAEDGAIRIVLWEPRNRW